MAFTEAQQQLILSVENDPGMGPDFLEDWATKEAWFDSSITDEARIQAKLELAQAYHDTSINEAEEKRAVVEETSAATTWLAMKNLQGSINESNEQLQESQSESVFEILEGWNSSLITKMATQLWVDSNTPEWKNEVMAFSDKIQNMWWLYIKWTVPEWFPLAIQENMSVALSFSLMKRLSNQNGDIAKKMNENAQWINKESGLSANIASLFGFLRKTTEFLPMMTKISRMASLIEFHQSALFAPDTDWKMNCKKLDCFNSPSACYQWMEKNNMILADKTPVESTSYESVFDQSYTLDNKLLVSIANKVNYDESTHKFMRDTVIPKWTTILEMRNNAQENLNPIYEQLSMIGKMFGYSVSDMVGEGTIGKVLNFVSLLVCGCNLKWLDKKHFMAEDWKNFPQGSKAWLSEAVAYASKFMDNYDPKEQWVNGSLLDKNLLQEFQSADYSKYEVNDTIPTAAMILPIVPTSLDAFDDGLYYALKSEKGFIPSATTLESIGLAWYYTTDENGTSVFDMNKKADLMVKLNTDANRQALVSMARQNTLTPDIIAGVAKNGGTREDVIALMYGSLLTSPDIMTKALEHDILDGVQLTQGIAISGMVNKWADSKKEQERVAEISRLEWELKTAESKLKAARDELKVVKDEEWDQTEIDAAKTKVDEAKENVRLAKEALKKAKNPDESTDLSSNNSDKPEDDVWSTDVNEWIDPTDVLTAWAAAAAWVVASSNTYTEDMKTSVEGLDPRKKLWELTFTEAKTFAYAIFGPGPATELLIKLSDGKPTLITRLVALWNHEWGLVFDRRNEDPNKASQQINIGTFQISEKANNIVPIYNKALATGMKILTDQWVQYDTTYFKTIWSYKPSPLHTPQEKAQHDVLAWLGHMKNCGRWESVLKLLTMEGPELAGLISHKLQVWVAGIGQWVLSQLRNKPLSVYLAKTKDIRSSSSLVPEKAPEIKEMPLASIGIRGDSTAVWFANKWYGSVPPAENVWKSSEWLLKNLPTSLLPNTILFGGRNDTQPWSKSTIKNMEALGQAVAKRWSNPILWILPKPLWWFTWPADRYDERDPYCEYMFSLNNKPILDKEGKDTWKKRRIVDCRNVDIWPDQLHADPIALNTIITDELAIQA